MTEKLEWRHGRLTNRCSYCGKESPLWGDSVVCNDCAREVADIVTQWGAESDHIAAMDVLAEEANQ